jgi:hypothetical protein
MHTSATPQQKSKAAKAKKQQKGKHRLLDHRRPVVGNQSVRSMLGQ